MNILRKMGVALFAFLLGSTLFGMAWANIGVATIHDRQTVMGWFDKSGFYDQIVDVILEKAKTGANDQTGSLPVDDPAIQAIAKQAFTPELIKTSVENVLNGSYDWLGGKSKDLAFTIDLTSAKTQLAVGIGTYVTNRVAALPVCALGLGNQSYDGFSATCRPKLLPAAEAGKQAQADFLKQDFLKDPIITADTLKVKDQSGSEIPISASTGATKTKTIYGLSGQAPIALGVLSLIFALAIVFISKERLLGIRKVGYLLLSTGVLLLVFYILLGTVFATASTKLTTAQSGTPKFVKLVTDFGRVVVTDIKAATFWYMIGFIVLGIAAIVTTIVLRKKQKPHKTTPKENVEQPQPETPPTPIVPQSPILEKPKHKEPRKLQF